MDKKAQDVHMNYDYVFKESLILYSRKESNENQSTKNGTNTIRAYHS